MQQCTLYMTLASRDDFFPLLTRLFSGWSLENSGDTLIAARRKLLSRQRIAFHLKSRDVDGASFTEMMRGMHDFFAAIPTDKESLKQSLLAQIKVFTLCVGVVADKDMDDATFGAVMTVAGEGHGLIFLPPADLYTADGATVFNADGESDFDSWTVTAPAALLVPPKATASGETGWGVFGVELFVLTDGSILFNEVSPRPHDTGMVTLISQRLSEFALHARAILGLPVTERHVALAMGDGQTAASHAIVVAGDGEAEFTGVENALAEPDTDLRIFAKPRVHGHRRMAVSLAIGTDAGDARRKAADVADALTLALAAVSPMR